MKSLAILERGRRRLQLGGKKREREGATFILVFARNHETGVHSGCLEGQRGKERGTPIIRHRKKQRWLHQGKTDVSWGIQGECRGDRKKKLLTNK